MKVSFCFYYSISFFKLIIGLDAVDVKINPSPCIFCQSAYSFPYSSLSRVFFLWALFSNLSCICLNLYSRNSYCCLKYFCWCLIFDSDFFISSFSPCSCCCCFLSLLCSTAVSWCARLLSLSRTLSYLLNAIAY